MLRVASRRLTAGLHRAVGSTPLRPSLASPPLLAARSRPVCATADATLRPLAGSVSDEPVVLNATATAFMYSESPQYKRFVNIMMKDGKKETSRKLLWQTFALLREGGHDPQEVFHTALDNVRPMLEMRTFQSTTVPFPLTPKRAEGQAMKWIIAAARKRGGGKFPRILANELLSASQHKGSAIQKKEDVHKAGVANQAAAHFRWRIGSTRLAGAIEMDGKSYRPIGRRVKRRLQGIMPLRE